MSNAPGRCTHAFGLCNFRIKHSVSLVQDSTDNFPPLAGIKSADRMFEADGELTDKCEALFKKGERRLWKTRFPRALISLLKIASYGRFLPVLLCRVFGSGLLLMTGGGGKKEVGKSVQGKRVL